MNWSGVMNTYLLRTAQSYPAKGLATNENPVEPIQTNHWFMPVLHKCINQHKSDDCRMYRSQKPDTTDNAKSLHRYTLHRFYKTESSSLVSINDRWKLSMSENPRDANNQHSWNHVSAECPVSTGKITKRVKRKTSDQIGLRFDKNRSVNQAWTWITWRDQEWQGS